MSVATAFNESYYLSNNADVVLAISQGHFSSALQHYQLFGGKNELRDPNSTFDASYYASKNPDVLTAVSNGLIANVFTHYQTFGEKENRAPSVTYENFTASAYLAANADVQAAVTAGTIASALEHYIAFGATESRSGSGITSTGTTGSTFTLTSSADNLTGTANNDTFNSTYDGTTASTLNVADSLAGGAGTDILNITASDDAVVTLPAATTSAIETINVRNVDGDATAQVLTVSGANFVGHTSLNADRSTDSVTFTGVASGATVGIIGNANVTNGAVVATYATAATAPIVSWSGGTLGTGAVTLTAAGGTSLTLNSTGAANVTGAVSTASTGILTTTINATTNLTMTSLAIGTNASSQSLVITGAGLVTMGALDTDFASINASANTGGVSATLSATTAATFTGGSGNDTVTTSVTGQTGTVNAGDGTDTLVVANAVDLDTSAEGAKFTNFETISVSTNINMANVTGSTITAITMTDGGNSITGMNATQAGAITITADAATNTFALATATGTSDVLGLTLKNSTSTASADATALTVTGFETMNVVSSSGASGDVNALSFAAAGNLTALNISGAAPISVTTTNITTAAAINAASMTGTFTVTGALATGSTVTGSSTGVNTMTVSATTGTTYTGGSANDSFTAAIANLAATGSNDNKIAGGTGTDTLTLTDVTPTITDNMFTNLSALETLALTATTGDASLTTGAAFNSAFSSGVTITSGTMAAGKDFTLAAGLSTVDTKLTIDATSLVGTAAEVHSLTTGSGADTITFTGDATYVGVNAAAQGTITISTGAGADTISVTVGNLLASTGGQFLTVTGGTGADSITKVGTNSTTDTSVAHFVVAAGDSLATSAGADTITGFDLADGTNRSDGIDFAGAAAVGTLGTSTDFGTILSHTITAGVASFDDAAVYATALVINSTNLADVVGYLAANTATNDVVAFTYDSDSSGSADATMVYHNGATDSLVLLAGVTTADAVITTNGTGANDLFVF